jgi:hypothetical protein
MRDEYDFSSGVRGRYTDRAGGPMTETSLVFSDKGEVIQFHLPPGRTMGSIPDTRSLWTTMWKYRHCLGGVAHTHPWYGTASPSHTDVTTWRACEQGLGKLLLWPIVTFSEVRYFVFNRVTGNYCEAPPPSFEVSSLERLRELSKEGA